MQERLEQLATQARSLAEEVGQLTEAAERGLEAHQLAVLKLHVKLATMPASQQKEEWGRLEGELPASLLTFLPSTEVFGTLGAGQGAPAPPEVEAAAPQVTRFEELMNYSNYLSEELNKAMKKAETRDEKLNATHKKMMAIGHPQEGAGLHQDLG